MGAGRAGPRQRREHTRSQLQVLTVSQKANYTSRVGGRAVGLGAEKVRSFCTGSQGR